MDKSQYRYREGITVEDAADCIKDHVSLLTETEEVLLLDSLGRTLAADVTAGFDQPPFDRAPVDGYACRACDTAGASHDGPVTLQVVEEIDAGGFSNRTVEPGQAVRIMTGAAIPDGCDCCIRQEDTNYGETQVEIYREMAPHANYCDQGEDFKAGTRMMKQGEKIGFVEIGNLAAMGLDRVTVYRKPRIALITTGDEVTEPGQALCPGQIYNSNHYLISSRLAELGVETVWTKCLKDDALQVADAVRQAVELGADAVITTGGVSVGKKDILHDSLDLLGAEKLFWRVNLKPGTPTVFAVFQGVPVICLTGNPFGAIANVELLIRPMLAVLTGDPSLKAEEATGVMADPFHKASPGRRFIRAIYRDGQVRLPDGLHSSGVLSTMKGCNCLVDIEPGTGALNAGDSVRVWLL